MIQESEALQLDELAILGDSQARDVFAHIISLFDVPADIKYSKVGLTALSCTPLHKSCVYSPWNRKKHFSVGRAPLGM
jgi:hypothetical protein